MVLFLFLLLLFGCGGKDSSVNSEHNENIYNENSFVVHDSIYSNSEQFSFSGEGRVDSLTLEYPLNFSTFMMQFSIISAHTSQNYNSKIVLFDENNKVLFKQKFNMDGQVTLNLDMPLPMPPKKVKLYLYDYSGQLKLHLQGHSGSITEEDDK